MGIFKRKTQSAAAPVADSAFTESEGGRVTALWRLTALPRDDFDTTYGAMLAGFWRYVRRPKGDEWRVLREQALTCAVAALRVRQSRVLPRFAAAEDVHRLAEGMSFALASCVVAERFAQVAGRAEAPGWRQLTDDVPAEAALGDDPVPRAHGALLLARLAGEVGIGWLGQEQAVIREVATYFGDGPSELRAIAEEAERRVGLPLVRTAAPSSGPSNPTAPASGTDGDASNAPAAAGDAVSAGPARQTDPVEIGTGGAGWRWINWVRAGLRDGTVVVNARDGWLHNIGGAAYVVAPDGFEAFAALEGLEPGTAKNRVSRLRRHRGRESRFGATGTFHARLADGRNVKGMMFPGGLFWDEDRPPEADAELRKPWQ